MTKARDLANAGTALTTVSATELGYLDGVTSSVQTQIDAKLASSTAATTYVANSLADAKGDLFVASADNTVTRLPVGSTGDTIVADNSTATGLRYQGNFSAGKNKIINGDFGVWQRGTSFTMTNSTTYFADRWRTYRDGSGSTLTVTRETFTPGTAPVAGYEGQYFARFNQSVAGTGGTFSAFSTPLEDVRTFAGQTVTVSFWAKADSAKSVGVALEQVFGSGGSSAVYPSAVSGGTASITTSWQRFQAVFNVTSISGKTIGTNSLLNVYLNMPLNQTSIIDIWGFQIEAGSVATAFQTATGTIQGELDACERYLPTITGAGNYYVGGQRNSTNAIFPIAFRVQPRVAPTGITISALSDFFMFNSSLGGYTPTSIAYNTAGLNTGALDVGVSGGTGAATGDAVFFRANANSKILFTGCEL